MAGDDLDPDPIVQLLAWRASVAWPASEEASLATVDEHGHPDARMVLVKRISAEGFEIHTNRTSAKGRHLAQNAWAALVFRWPPDRQVRARGPVVLLDDEASDAYFAARPRGSQLGAWASPQSEPIGSRAELELRLAEVSARFPEPGAVPRPPFWGGYRLVPEVVELWEHREDRLHDRFLYTRASDPAVPTGWRRTRLAP